MVAGEGRRGLDGLDADLVAWVERTLGAPITSATRPEVGGSRATWFVVAGTTEAVLRLEAGSAFSGTEVDVAREAVVYRALASTPVPVPTVMGVAPGGAAILLERLPGSSDIAPDACDSVLADFVDVLATLHALDVGALDLPGFEVPHTPEDHARLDLSSWASLATGAHLPLDALARYAGAYLLAHPPVTVARTSLLQGDTGIGNFVASDRRVRGLVDMEFAHVGDPMDDIAWVLMRGLGDDTEPLLARYSERSGIPLDRSSITYYSVAVRFRCVITTTLAIARGGGARGWAAYLMATERFLRELATTLARHVGVTVAEVELPEEPPTARTPWYDELLDGIRAGVRGIDDPDLREHTRNEQILVHYLRAYDRLGPALDALDRDDAMASRVDPDDVAAVEAAGARADEVALRYLLRRRQRQQALWSSLFDRTVTGRTPAS